MPKNCSKDRPPVWSVPGPLPGWDVRAGGRVSSAPSLSPAEEAAARRARLEDIPMCRYSHPIPTATCTEESEVACLLQWQNGLLCELLGTVNALLALGLGRPPQDPPSCP